MQNFKPFLSAMIIVCLSTLLVVIQAAPAAGIETMNSSEFIDVSERIRIIQYKLHWVGYQTGPADGIFGPKTSRAISLYQKDHGIPRSGFPDQRFLEDLYKRVPDKPK